MSDLIINKQIMSDIASAIREVGGTEDNMTPAEMVSAIDQMQLKNGFTVSDVAMKTMTRVVDKDATVTELRSRCFLACSSLKAAKFPACTTINHGAFIDCSMLSDVSFPEVAYMSGAFMRCKALFSVDFPKLEVVGSDCFSGCTYLYYFNAPNVTSIHDGAFKNTKIMTVSFPLCSIIGVDAFYQGNVRTISLPECLVIGAGAFSSCTSLATVYLPKCKSIYTNGFYNCYNITSLVAPELEYIGSSAFGYNERLTSVYFSKATSVAAYAFRNCKRLISVNLPALSSNILNMGMFSSCVSLTTLVIPSDITRIVDYAFANCTSLENLESIANRATECGAYAFMSTRIVSIHNDKEVYFGQGAFRNCSMLEIAEFTNTVSTYGILMTYAFSNCSKLRTVSLSMYSASIIGSNAFINCSALTSITLNSNVTMISSSAFMNCSSLSDSAEALLSSYVKVVGDYAFANTAIRSLNTRLNEIYYNAFENCSNLSIVNIINDEFLKFCGPFCKCVNLKDVRITTPSVSFISGDLFESCYNLMTLTLNVPTVINFQYSIRASSAFNSTPIAGYWDSSYYHGEIGTYGSIYVPASLVDSYKSALGWSSLADRFVAIEE